MVWIMLISRWKKLSDICVGKSIYFWQIVYIALALMGKQPYPPPITPPISSFNFGNSNQPHNLWLRLVLSTIFTQIAFILWIRIASVPAQPLSVLHGQSPILKVVISICPRNVCDSAHGNDFEVCLVWHQWGGKGRGIGRERSRGSVLKTIAITPWTWVALALSMYDSTWARENCKSFDS